MCTINGTNIILRQGWVCNGRTQGCLIGTVNYYILPSFCHGHCSQASFTSLILGYTNVGTPPVNMGLDVCRYGKKAGSIAIYQVLQAYQPKYALHGQSHESPDVWESQIGKTIYVQPGQMTRYSYVIIDCLTNTVDRYED